MLIHSLASKYARFVVIVRQIYWTPPFRPLDPPLLKSDDLFLGNQEILDPPLSKILDTPLRSVTNSTPRQYKSQSLHNSFKIVPGHQTEHPYYNWNGLNPVDS